MKIRRSLGICLLVLGSGTFCLSTVMAQQPVLTGNNKTNLDSIAAKSVEPASTAASPASTQPATTTVGAQATCGDGSYMCGSGDYATCCNNNDRCCQHQNSSSFYCVAQGDNCTN